MEILQRVITFRDSLQASKQREREIKHQFFAELYEIDRLSAAYAVTTLLSTKEAGDSEARRERVIDFPPDIQTNVRFQSTFFISSKRRSNNEKKTWVDCIEEDNSRFMYTFTEKKQFNGGLRTSESITQADVARLAEVRQAMGVVSDLICIAKKNITPNKRKEIFAGEKVTITAWQSTDTPTFYTLDIRNRKRVYIIEEKCEEKAGTIHVVTNVETYARGEDEQYDPNATIQMPTPSRISQADIGFLKDLANVLKKQDEQG